MKTLYLLRHAKSSWKQDALADIDRPLSKRGRAAAEAVGGFLAAHHIEPGQILCSPAKRTRETLEYMQRRFDAALPTRFEKGLYLAEAPALLRRLRRLSDSIASLMIIGHNPGLERLALILIGDQGDEAARQALGMKFPTGALAEIACAMEHWADLAPGSGSLERFVRPKDLLSEEQD
jgi:phosphohistidine phosphatase